jgi:hypothetical protein
MATKRKQMAKPRQKERPCHQGDHVQKVQESPKNQENKKKGSEEGAAPASIAKESQADREGRGQTDITELNE